MYERRTMENVLMEKVGGLEQCFLTAVAFRFADLKVGLPKRKGKLPRAGQLF